MKDFYIGDSKCYFLDTIRDSETYSKKFLFTTSRDVLELYSFTGKIGFSDVYIHSKNVVLKFSADNLVLPKSKCSNLELGLYKHFKGGEYLTLGVALELQSNKELVIYESLCSNGKTFCREKTMFLENVVSSEYNYSGPRFNFISKE